MKTAGKLLLVCALMAVFHAAPALAADEELNSGFGRDMFAGEEHPAFTDPSIHDPMKLNDIVPSAGEESGKPEDVAPASGEEKKELPPGTGGMKSSILVQ